MKLSENNLVRKIAKALGSSGARRLQLGMGDDAALLASKPGLETILTCDWFLEGRHFLRKQHPPDSAGWKCLARALSDIAAMGGRPKCFLLSLALPGALSGPWLDTFLTGLRRAARRFDCPLAGGDITRSRRVLVSVTIIGEVRAGKAIRRAGARVGDSIFVSGRLGEAEVGLRSLRRGMKDGFQKNRALRKHLYPEPRLALGEFLANRKLATAMMDLSDGLSSDLPRLCSASRVGARIETAELLKVSLAEGDPKISGLPALQLALNGGDDYELLFTVSRRLARRIPATYGKIPLTCIGQITRGRGVFLRNRDHDEPLLPQGWDPFRRGRRE
ncbi:MAG TPA: thiamine-phosphate kinase [Candidatus Acidoferrum sp.]|nr:thiamine-phosphate kinase [Candidatus Acidoferrum sp.]